MSIRLIVADSQPVVRAGLRSFFLDTDIEIVEEVATGEQLVARTLRFQPDAVLLDTVFPDVDAFETVARLRRLEYRGRIVFFSDAERAVAFARAEAAGADSYILKKTPAAELVRSVHQIVAAPEPPKRPGEHAFPGELRHAARLRGTPGVNPLGPLTNRETQVLRHVVFGLSNKEIAASLGLSLDTVKEHIGNILRKLDVKDRTGAAVWAVQNGLPKNG